MVINQQRKIKMTNEIKTDSKKLETKEEFIEALENLQKEVNTGVLMIWALVTSCDGRIIIPDSVMESANEGCSIESYYDSEKEITVIEAIEKPSKIIH